MVFCDEKNIDFLSTRNDTELGTSQMLFNPKSHIDKFADSWLYYAKANDIAKREKLKMALKDALHSIEKPQKHSVVSNVDLNSVKRIKEAAILLKEFKQMYSLSQNVKRTLSVYKQAREKLVDDKEIPTKGDLLYHEQKKSDMENKRDRIPSYESQKSFIDKAIDAAGMSEGKLQLRKPIIIKRTSRISVKANLLENGEVGIDYSSIDPRYSNVEQAERAMRAAKIILKYAGASKKLASQEDSFSKPIDANRKSVFPTPLRHWEGKEQGLSKIVNDVYVEKPTAKTIIPGIGIHAEAKRKSGESSVLESLVNGDDELPPEDKAAIESLGKESTDNKFQTTNIIASDKTKISVKKEVVNRYVGQLKKLYSRYLQIKGENDTVDNALEFQNEIINSNLGNASLIDNLTVPSTSEQNLTTSDESKERTEAKDETKQDDKFVPKPTGDDVSSNKQDDTMRQLKEARLAKVRYEVAKHELAHKIKELYVLANNYEKDETENQILEVKNLISHTPSSKGTVIPGAKTYEKVSITSSETAASEKPTPSLDPTNNDINQRDDVHPGVGLTGVINHLVKSVSASESEGEHKGFTMGAKDKSEHQVELPSSIDAINVKKEYEYLQLPKDHKAAEKKEDSAKGKNDDETLSIIAQAIQEDMKEIRKGDKEHVNNDEVGMEQVNQTKPNKILGVNMSEGHNDKEGNDLEHTDKGNSDTQHKDSHNFSDTKQDLPYNNESVDEYLTKALSDIISQDTANSNQGPALPERDELSDDNPTVKLIEPSEENKNVVEKAMKQHAKNPNLPLPLIDTKGDKIKLNAALNTSFNDNETPATTTAEIKPQTDAPKPPAPAAVPLEQDKRPVAATKPPPNPSPLPTDVSLHVTGKNLSTALPDIDLHDPENKQLLDKASHMEESIAAAQDQLYGAVELKSSDSDVEVHKGTSMIENPSKAIDTEQKQETSSRNTLTSTQDVRPVPVTLPSTVASVSPPLIPEESTGIRPFYGHQADPYGSIQEHASVSEHMQLPGDVDDTDSEDGKMVFSTHE